MEQCNICGEFYNPVFLSEVAEHLHANIELDKEYYGKEVEKFERGGEDYDRMRRDS